MTYDLSNPPDWFTREAQRFASGDYTAPPWPEEFTNHPGHFVHLSKAEPGLLAYTPSDRHGREDRQSRIKPGKYLTKYFPHLTGPQIARMAGMVSALEKPPELHIARTREEIAHVYRNGPDSCMAGLFENLKAHPAEVYAGPDTAVAYLKGRNNRIVARTVIRLSDPKGYMRLYGDTERLAAALEEHGYGENVSFEGVRLLHIEHDDRHFIMPYIDSGPSADARSSPRRGSLIDGYVVLSDEGEFELRNTTGTVYMEEMHTCACCGEGYSECEMTTIDDEDYCTNCRDEHFVLDYWSNWISSDHVVEAYVNRWGARDFIHYDRVDEGTFRTCFLTDEVWHVDYMSQVGVEWASDRALEENDEYQQCHETDNWYHVSEMIEIDGKWHHKDSESCRSHPHQNSFTSDLAA